MGFTSTVYGHIENPSACNVTVIMPSASSAEKVGSLKLTCTPEGNSNILHNKLCALLQIRNKTLFDDKIATG